MNYSLNDELINIENKIFLKYNNDKQLTGLVKTSIQVSPTNLEFLELKSRLKKSLSNTNTNYYIDDIEFTYNKYSKYIIFTKKHEWDIIGIIFTFGLITPFLLPNIIMDLREYYNSKNYNYIGYNIKIIKSPVI